MLTKQEFGAAIAKAINLKIQTGAIRSQADVARHFGVKPPSVSDWIKKGAISKDKLMELYRYFSDVAGHEHWGLTKDEWPSGLSLDDPQPLQALRHHVISNERDFDGRVDVDEIDEISIPKFLRKSSNEVPQPPTEDEFSFVKQLDLHASCGNGRFEEHVVVKGGLAFKRSSLRALGVSEQHARIIYADGTSMEPTVGHGRVVLVNLADTAPIDGKVYLICDPDGATYLKRLVREYHHQIGGMAWIMRSDNQNKKDFPDKLLPDDARTHIIGRAVWNDNTL